jgi:benzoylformate decarboxylase
VQRTEPREGPPPGPFPKPAPLAPPAPGEPLRAGHVFDALAQRLPADAILVEESPSSRPELHARVPARGPMGFLSAAMGGLGFALPGTIGVRMALPDRPVVAVLGDGSSLYAIQALWSAARYRVGALLLVMANGRYAIMDKLAADTGQPAPWPAFDTIDIAAMARAQGCEAIRIEDHADLIARLDEVLPELAHRGAPLLLEIAIAP